MSERYGDIPFESDEYGRDGRMVSIGSLILNMGGIYQDDLFSLESCRAHNEDLKSEVLGDLLCVGLIKLKNPRSTRAFWVATVNDLRILVAVARMYVMDMLVDYQGLTYDQLLMAIPEEVKNVHRCYGPKDPPPVVMPNWVTDAPLRRINTSELAHLTSVKGHTHEELLTRLRETNDPAEKRKIRSRLRSLGHVGGLRGTA